MESGCAAASISGSESSESSAFCLLTEDALSPLSLYGPPLPSSLTLFVSPTTALFGGSVSLWNLGSNLCLLDKTTNVFLCFCSWRIAVVIYYLGVFQSVNNAINLIIHHKPKSNYTFCSFQIIIFRWKFQTLELYKIFIGLETVVVFIFKSVANFFFRSLGTKKLWTFLCHSPCCNLIHMR